MNFTINNFIQFILLSTKLLTTKILLLQNSLEENSDIIEIPNGKLLGQIHNNYISFKSIPYAEPPIGENRFESPKPYLEKWQGIRDARNYTHKNCLQLAGYISESDGDENCLYLNIFIPKLKSKKLYPVMFFIHGGSFNFGSGNEFPEENIMKNENFIYVSINYRLGAFGFLSTQDEQISGNMGLKDQRLAIKWVKKNIRKFNGNPNEILLCGWSAGGASVHYHLLSSQKIENLFKVAVSFSGTALNSWAFDYSPLEKLYKLAKSLNCPINNTTIIKNCLKNIPASNIIINSYEFLILPFDFPPKGFTPVIESSNVKDRFLDDFPENKIRHNKIKNVPWLVTYTAEEAAHFAPNILTDLQTFNKDFNTILPILLFFNDNSKLTSADKLKLISNLRLKYNVPENITEKDYCNVQKMFSDEQIIRKAEESVRLHQEYSKSPVFMYCFDHQPENTDSYNDEIITNLTDINFGTGHGDDMQLIFYYKQFNNNNNNYKNEYLYKISTNILNMLQHFVKTGIPIYDNIKLPHNLGKSNVIKYLNIGRNNSISIKSKRVDLI